MTSRRLNLPMLVLALGTAACSGNSTLTAPSATGPTTFSFSSAFAERGSASRSFEQLTTGAITVTLSAVTPAVPLGVGLGIPRPDGAGCNLTRSVEARADTAAQITATAEAGVWCVRVWDAGAVTERVTFTLDVSHY